MPHSTFVYCSHDEATTTEITHSCLRRASLSLSFSFTEIPVLLLLKELFKEQKEDYIYVDFRFVHILSKIRVCYLIPHISMMLVYMALVNRQHGLTCRVADTTSSSVITSSRRPYFHVLLTNLTAVNSRL